MESLLQLFRSISDMMSSTSDLTVRVKVGAQRTREDAEKGVPRGLRGAVHPATLHLSRWGVSGYEREHPPRVARAVPLVPGCFSLALAGLLAPGGRSF